LYVRTLLVYTAVGEAINAIRYKKAEPDFWGYPNAVIVTDEETPSVHDCPVIRIPNAYRNGLLCVSALMNRGLDYACEINADWVIIMAADNECLQAFTPPQTPVAFCPVIYEVGHGESPRPASDFDIFWKDKIGEKRERLMTGRNFPFEIEGPGYSNCLVLAREVIQQCRYCEEFAGYGGEDDDFAFNVLRSHGYSIGDDGPLLLHRWHPRREGGWSKRSDLSWREHEIANRNRYLRRTVAFMRLYGMEMPMPPALAPQEWEAIEQELKK
jgi:hypothetical protein